MSESNSAYSIVGNGYKCLPYANPGAKTSKFWLEATFDDATSELVLTSMLELDLTG